MKVPLGHNAPGGISTRCAYRKANSKTLRLPRIAGKFQVKVGWGRKMNSLECVSQLPKPVLQRLRWLQFFGREKLPFSNAGRMSHLSRQPNSCARKNGCKMIE